MMPKPVLVADADDDMRNTYATVLRQCGHVALEARTVSEALGLITWHMPAAVISGRMALGGCELLQSLKQHPLTADIPVILVTTDADPDRWGEPVRRLALL